MVLNIDIPPKTEERLREQAKAAGKEVREYVTQIVEQAASRPSFDEQLASIRLQFAATGVSDDELIQDITDAQSEYRTEQAKKI